MVGPLYQSDDGSKPSGGRLLLEMHPVELRVQIYKSLYAGAFFDCGGVFSNYRDAHPSTLRYSAGGGLSVRTAIGVLRVEAGLPLDRKANEPWIWPHIDIGYAF